MALAPSVVVANGLTAAQLVLSTPSRLLDEIIQLIYGTKSNGFKVNFSAGEATRLKNRPPGLMSRDNSLRQLTT